jgi:hypothetical protein
MWNAFLERRKRIDMMSTALVMVAGGEQTKVRAATSVRVESGEITFAQSFGERVDLSTDVQTMNSTGDASNGMREGKSSGLVKNSDAPSDASSGVKPNGIVDQRIMGGNETKSVAVTLADSADKNVIVETNLVALANASGRGKSITTPGQPLSNGGVLQQDTAAKIVPQTGLSQTKTTEAAEAIGSEELPAGNVKEVAEASSSVSEELPLAASTNVDAVPRESTALADRSLLSRDAIEPTDQNEKVLAGKTVDVASAKRDAKPQESAVVAKAASKTTGMTESAKADGDALLGTAVQGAIPLPTQEAATSDGQRNADSVTAANVTGLSGVIPGKLAAAAVSPTDGTNRKVIPKVEKSEVEVTGQSAIPPTGTTAATGFGAEIAQAVMVASTAEKDADPKGLSAVGVAASVHGVAGSEGAVSGIVAGMMSGHTPAEVSETKAQAGEAGVHSATSQAGLTEQDGFGAAASEMGMAHRTLLATPMALEVGVSNGTQGWLKIRAEMTDGGVVNASLSSASSAGQEMLHRELPALTAYLQEERVGVNTVIVPSTAAAGTDSRFAGGMDREGGGQSQQGSSQGGTDDGQRLIRGSTADEIPMYMALNGVGEDGLLSPGPYAGGGSWLNVRA